MTATPARPVGTVRPAELADQQALFVRPATPTDWPAMWPLWHEVVAAGDTYCYDPGTSADEARAMWLSTDPRSETWLGEAGGLVRGMYKIVANQAGPGRHIANGSYMVAASSRGTGIGRLLVRHSLDRAAALGYRGMQFNAVADTNRGAIALYEALGFTTVGVIPGGFDHPGAGPVGLRIMYREITKATE